MPAIVLAALGALVTIPVVSSSTFYAASPERFATVVVHSGDNLWSLAEAKTPSDGSVQETVDKIVAANHLSGAAIVPGQKLRIPR
jgi:nucleoid-associated protein YgaU